MRRWFLLGTATASVLVMGGLGARSFVFEPPPMVDAPVLPAEIAPAVLVPAEPDAIVLEPQISPAEPIATSPAAPLPLVASTSGVLLDQRFSSGAGTWPNDPHGPGWFAAGTYRLAASYVSHFIALGIPGAQALGDAKVTGWFRKVGGPGGGGYGLVLRSQEPESLDGFSQSGRYYVFEVGDHGEVGVWLRDGEQWIDVQVWTPSESVHQGIASNELTVTAVGDQLTFLVNGVPVASHTDMLLHTGDAGVFVGGDRNEVALDRISVSSGR